MPIDHLKITYPPMLALAGATGLGKTAIALELSSEFPIEIISVDAVQVYRGLDIGSAKATLEERSNIPHHLIDVCDVWDTYDAARFLHDVSAALQGIQERHHLALFVGGSMMYMHALTQGLIQLPKISPTIREEIESWGRSQQDPNALWKRLQQQDPMLAERLHPNDHQRILRGLEVVEGTRIPLSTYQNQSHRGILSPDDVVGWMPADRAAHAEILERRFKQMVDEGFVEEVRRLYQDPRIHEACPAMKSVGYYEILGYLKGHWNWDEAKSKALAGTRQLCKRQMTWLRRYPGKVLTAKDEVKAALRHKLAR